MFGSKVGILHNINDIVARLDVNGSIGAAIRTITSDDNINNLEDSTIIIDGSSSAVEVTLPYASNGKHCRFTILAKDTTNTCTVSARSGETINGSADYTFSSNYEKITVQSDGSEWFIIG